jgi:hypothetical protein
MPDEIYPDDRPQLTPEELASVKRGLEDMRAGRIYTKEEVGIETIAPEEVEEDPFSGELEMEVATGEGDILNDEIEQAYQDALAKAKLEEDPFQMDLDLIQLFLDLELVTSEKELRAHVGTLDAHLKSKVGAAQRYIRSKMETLPAMQNTSYLVRAKSSLAEIATYAESIKAAAQKVYEDEKAASAKAKIGLIEARVTLCKRVLSTVDHAINSEKKKIDLERGR